MPRLLEHKPVMRTLGWEKDLSGPGHTPAFSVTAEGPQQSKDQRDALMEDVLE